ncbi:MAG: hypothetical protein OEY14_11305, partial [Myxococcales bacterium]|nr:hypothetical protein [Myxococcales bacterium]
LALPPSRPELRLFCLVPLWMAARTLVLGRGEDAMFRADEDVKISRDEVECLISECVAIVADDGAIRDAFARLWTRGDLATARYAACDREAVLERGRISDV